jgi:hypothetical protein
MTPQAAKMRIRLELIILVFMVRCVLTNLGLQVESTSTAGVNSIFRLSRKCKTLGFIWHTVCLVDLYSPHSGSFLSPALIGRSSYFPDWNPELNICWRKRELANV